MLYIYVYVFKSYVKRAGILCMYVLVATCYTICNFMCVYYLNVLVYFDVIINIVNIVRKIKRENTFDS